MGVRVSPRSTVHIGVAGPCSPRLFAEDLDLPPGELPEGLGGTPVNHLVREFLDAGHQVTLATLDRGHEDRNPVIFRGPSLTLTVGRYRNRARHRATDFFLAERQAIASGLRGCQPDVISAHWTYEFALGAIATGLPTLITVHDVPRAVFRMQPTPYRAVRWLMHRAVMRRATRLAFNSPYTRSRLGHAGRTRGLVLPNPLPDRQFTLPERPLPTLGNASYISVNNGFGRRKNIARLLEAFAQVRRQFTASRLMLVGAGYEQTGPANAWALAHELTEGVDFVGAAPYDETMRLIQAADVLVHPSLEESFGYTLIEAASVGTPVIAGRDSGAVPWVLAGGEAGTLVDVTQPSQIAEAMLRVVADPGEWLQLRQRAFELTRERFSVSKVAAAYVEALEDLAR